MEKRRFAKTVLNSLILIGFVVVAMASGSSNSSGTFEKDFKEGLEEGYKRGYEWGKSLRSPLSEETKSLKVSPDSIYFVSVKDYAMNN